MTDISQAERQVTSASRATNNKQLNRSSSTPDSSPVTSKPRQSDGDKAPFSEKALAAAREKREKDLRDNVELGIIEGRNYEFKNTKGKSSWVKITKDKATFVDTNGKTFLTLSYSNLHEILKTTGDKLQNAADKYDSSEVYRKAQVRQYYSVFKPGNVRAKNELGSGQFRYEISMQHLADSVSNELKHVSEKIGWDGARKFFEKFADNNHEMECWGTTMQNVLKARGLVAPTMERQEFEKTYRAILNSLSQDQRDAMFGRTAPLKRLGKYGTKATLETLVSKFSQLEWAQFTGMNGRKSKVRVLNSAKEVEEVVNKGQTAFVGVPGHYKSAVGGTSKRFSYDDPLGLWGHLLYDNQPVSYGAVIE